MASEYMYALGETDGEDGKTLTYLRGLTEAESAETKRAYTALRPLTEESAMARLREETTRLSDAMQQVLNSRGTANIRESGREVHRQFDIWLRQFRACDDHTSHQLSATFGDSSTVFALFKSLLSQEYDRNFAYRLCWQLRNSSEHVGDVINAMRVDYEADDDSQDGRYTLVSRLDPADLVVKFPKMKPAVRTELQSCSGHLELVLLVRAVCLSWDRIYRGLLRGIWPEIAPLVDLCTRLHQEASVVSGAGWAVFIDAEPTDLPNGRWHMRHNPYDRAELVTRNLTTAEASRDRDLVNFPCELFISHEDNESPSLPI